MSIKASEDILFDEWRERRPGFVADGIADEDLFSASLPKLLFILKEVNDLDGGGWDLRQFIRKGGRAQTWDNITRWVEGIRSLPHDLPWSSIGATVDNERRVNSLRSIGAMNLKKSPGGHTTNTSDLWTVAIEDKEFLNRQFRLYAADIVVCCGTSDIFHQLIDLEKPKWRATTRGVWFHEYEPKKTIIEFAHPQARGAPNLLYYGLIDALQEIQATTGA